MTKYFDVFTKAAFNVKRQLHKLSTSPLKKITKKDTYFLQEKHNMKHHSCKQNFTTPISSSYQHVKVTLYNTQIFSAHGYHINKVFDVLSIAKGQEKKVKKRRKN